MAEVKYDEDFHCKEDEKEFVKELCKFGIYGNQTSYAGIVAAAKKNLDESRSRLKDLKTFFGDKQKEGKTTLRWKVFHFNLKLLFYK